MDLYEDIIHVQSKKKKRLIDSDGDDNNIEQDKNLQENARPIQKSNEKQSKAKNKMQINFMLQNIYPLGLSEQKFIKEDNKQVINKRKLKYLFEPDESLQNDTPSEHSIKPVKKTQKQQPILAPIKKQRENQQIDNLENLRQEILKRWWYCFDEWPPIDYDYNQRLKQYNLRRVEASIFNKEPEIDEDGLRKVYQVEGFVGVYKTSQGDTLDLRPQDTCPSKQNIDQINPKTLPRLYVKGLKRQLEDLIKYEVDNIGLQQQLQTQIKVVQRKFNQYLE